MLQIIFAQHVYVVQYEKRKKRWAEDVLSPSALSGGTPFIMGFRLSFFLFSKIVFEKKKTKTFLE